MNSGPVRSCWGAHTHSVSVKQQVIQYSSLDRVHVAFTVPRFCSIYHMVPHLTTLRYTHIRGNCSDYRTIGQCLVYIAVHHLSWWFLANPGNTIQFQWGSLVLANLYHIYTVLSVVQFQLDSVMKVVSLQLSQGMWFQLTLGKEKWFDQQYLVLATPGCSYAV